MFTTLLTVAGASQIISAFISGATLSVSLVVAAKSSKPPKNIK